MSTADEHYYRFGQITYSLFISYAITPISRYQTTGKLICKHHLLAKHRY